MRKGAPRREWDHWTSRVVIKRIQVDVPELTPSFEFREDGRQTLPYWVREE